MGALKKEIKLLLLIFKFFLSLFLGVKTWVMEKIVFVLYEFCYYCQLFSEDSRDNAVKLINYKITTTLFFFSL